MACVIPKLGLFGGRLKPPKNQSPKPGLRNQRVALGF
jgi:hypothetical protein